jgi:hypothetical protein
MGKNKKHIKPGTKIGLKLTAAERKRILDDVVCLDVDYAQVIRNTPATEPVAFTLDEWEDLGDFIAAEANDTSDKKLQKTLDRVFEKIQGLFTQYDEQGDAADCFADFLMRLAADDEDEPVILPIRPREEQATLSIRLTELQRDAIMRATQLRPGLKNRLKEGGSGTQAIPFSRKELDELQSEIGQAACDAPSPYQKRLQAVSRKLADAQETDE